MVDKNIATIENLKQCSNFVEVPKRKRFEFYLFMIY